MFFSKSPKEKLNIKYKKLMEEAYNLSKTDRSKSDAKYLEADEVLKQIDKLPN
jgi:hypothetical protein